MALAAASHRARSLYLRKEYVQCYALACETHSGQPGDADVNFLLAKCLEHGHGTEVNLDLAKRHYRLAIEAGNSLAARSLGALYERTGCFEDAMDCFQQASESGRLNATFSLAQLHQKQGHAAQAEQLYAQVLGGNSPKKLPTNSFTKGRLPLKDHLPQCGLKLRGLAGGA